MPDTTIYEIAPELRETAGQLIDAYHEHLHDCDIVYMWRIGRWYVKGVKQVGKTIVVPQIWRELSGYDLVVVVNKSVYECQGEKDKIALLDNLLCHFGMTSNGNLFTRDHDIKEFSEAVRRNKICMTNFSAVSESAEIKKLEVPDDPVEKEDEIIDELSADGADEEEPFFVIEDMDDVDDTNCTVTSLVNFD